MLKVLIRSPNIYLFFLQKVLTVSLNINTLDAGILFGPLVMAVIAHTVAPEIFHIFHCDWKS